MFVGGSGIVPLIAMLRQRILTGSAQVQLVLWAQSRGLRLPRCLRRRGHTGRDVRVVLHTVNQVVATDAESFVTIRGGIANTL